MQACQIEFAKHCMSKCITLRMNTVLKKCACVPSSRAKSNSSQTETNACSCDLRHLNLYTLVDVGLAIDGKDQSENRVGTSRIHASVDRACVVAGGAHFVETVAAESSAHRVEFFAALHARVDLPVPQATTINTRGAQVKGESFVFLCSLWVVFSGSRLPLQLQIPFTSIIPKPLIPLCLLKRNRRLLLTWSIRGPGVGPLWHWRGTRTSSSFRGSPIPTPSAPCSWHLCSSKC